MINKIKEKKVMEFYDIESNARKDLPDKFKQTFKPRSNAVFVVKEK